MNNINIFDSVLMYQYIRLNDYRIESFSWIIFQD